MRARAQGEERGINPVPTDTAAAVRTSSQKILPTDRFLLIIEKIAKHAAVQMTVSTTFSAFGVSKCLIVRYQIPQTGGDQYHPQSISHHPVLATA